MSTSVSEHQKNKGHGNLGKPFNNKLPNGPKDHHNVGDRDEVDSWRSQPQPQHQGYSAGMGATTDPYMSSYYGSFQYPAGPGFGVSDGGPWSNGGDMAFMGGGYSSGLHDPAPPSAHYNNMEGGMFGGGNASGFGNFGAQPQPGFGYGFQGNGGDYNAWGQPRKPSYDDYYRSREGMYGDGMKMLDGMSGLSLNDKDHSFKEMKEMMSGSSKKPATWATIASQPAKPQSLMKKKAGMGGMPPPPIMLGTWEKNGSIPKTPIAAPVQAPHPPAWERMERVPKMAPPPGPPPSQSHPQSLGGYPPAPSGGGRVGSGGYQGGHMNYNMPPPVQSQQQQQQQQQQHQPPPLQQSHSQQQHNTNVNSSTNVVTVPTPPALGKQSPSSPQYPDEAKMKSDYNPAHFDVNADGARFFVIKSYSEDDIHRSIKYEIWCSTENGNKRLDDAWREREGKGPIYLFFSVNASGHFCGMAQMMSGVDHEASSSVWCQDKWKGQFKVKWVYVKDVPNPALRHIRLENNENKSVTNSRDTQEVPHEKGKQVLKILHTYQHTTSIFDDFVHYEKRQEEEDHRRTAVVPSSYPSAPSHERGDRGRGGGGHRGGSHNDHHNSRERGDFGHRDNPRDRDHHHQRERDTHHDDRPLYQNHSQGRGMRGGGGFDRERDNFGRGGGGFDRTGGGERDRDFYRDRGDPHRGSSGGGVRGRPARS